MFINLPILYNAISKNYLTVVEAVNLLNSNVKKFNLNDELLIELNLLDSDKNAFLQVLKEHIKANNLEQGIDYPSITDDIYQLTQLINIKNKNISIRQKLEDIANCWPDFNYPQKWRSFIYYMPSEKEETSEDTLYLKFLSFIRDEKHRLSKLLQSKVKVEGI
ncbi:MAG: hypothetical protein Tsb006_7260 [Rickettsiaceae bacterium]